MAGFPFLGNKKHAKVNELLSSTTEILQLIIQYSGWNGGNFTSSSLFPVSLSCPDLPYLSRGLAFSENNTAPGTNAGCDALLT